MPVSDEIAEYIRKQAEAKCTGLVMQITHLQNCLKELLDDREERIRDREAVIAKIGERMRMMTASHPCWQELREILDFIRNPKEAVSQPPTADSKEEKK